MGSFIQKALLSTPIFLGFECLYFSSPGMAQASAPGPVAEIDTVRVSCLPLITEGFEFFLSIQHRDLSFPCFHP